MKWTGKGSLRDQRSGAIDEQVEDRWGESRVRLWITGPDAAQQYRANFHAQTASRWLRAIELASHRLGWHLFRHTRRQQRVWLQWNRKDGNAHAWFEWAVDRGEAAVGVSRSVSDSRFDAIERLLHRHLPVASFKLVNSQPIHVGRSATRAEVVRVMQAVRRRASRFDRPTAIQSVEGLHAWSDRTQHAIGNAAVDVLFVHGLGGDAKETWRHPTAPTAWPQWVAEDRRVCVWSVSLPSHASAWHGASLPIPDLCQHLLARLVIAGFGQRPIVWIGHSLGGIVIKELLVRAAQRSGLDARDARGLVASTAAVVFLGTPHQGSAWARWMQRLPRWLGVTGLLRMTPLVDGLALDDTWLRSSHHAYRELVAQHRHWVHLAFAEHRSPMGRPIVAPSIADPGLTGVTVVPIPLSHRMICKPANRQQIVYRSVERLIHGIVRGSSGENADDLPRADPCCRETFTRF
jgi:hypothetical protein